MANNKPGRPTSKTKKIPVPIRFSPEGFNELEAVCAIDGRNPSVFLEALVHLYGRKLARSK